MRTAFAVPPADARAKKERQYRVEKPRRHDFARRPEHWSGSDLWVQHVHIRRARRPDRAVLPLILGWGFLFEGTREEWRQPVATPPLSLAMRSGEPYPTAPLSPSEGAQ